MANFIHCNINIFCILIPRLLLRAFERYIVAKNAYFASKHGQSNQSSMLTNNGVPKDTAKEIQNAILDGDVNIKGELSSKMEGKEKEIQDGLVGHATIYSVLALALACARESPKDRPTMLAVLETLVLLKQGKVIEVQIDTNSDATSELALLDSETTFDSSL